MKTRRLIFFSFVALITLILLGVNISTILIQRQLWPAPSLVYLGWVLLSSITLLPVLMAPLDRGRTIKFLMHTCFGLGFKAVLAWHLSQFFILLTSVAWLPWLENGSVLRWVPFLVVLVVTFIVGRAHRVVGRHVEIKIKNLPQELQGLRILHISDVHAGPFMTPRHLRRVIDNILEVEKFDFVALTGDLVNHEAHEADWALGELKRLAPPLGFASILGNHEYIDNENTVIEAHHKHLIPLLRQSSRLIEHNGHTIEILGVDYPFEHEKTPATEIRAALQPLAKPTLRVLLSHNPDGFDAAQECQIPLTLAGHTHGGQIRILGRNIIGGLVRYTRGVYHNEGHFMFVNSALGNWMPFRINCPCEYAVIKII